MPAFPWKLIGCKETEDGYSLFDLASLQPGELWSEPGNPCMTHKCEKIQDVFMVVTTKTECPKINCAPVSLGFLAPSQGGSSCGDDGEGWMASRHILSSGRASCSCLPLASCLIPPFLDGSLPPDIHNGTLLAQGQAQLREDGCCYDCLVLPQQSKRGSEKEGVGPNLGQPGRD